MTETLASLQAALADRYTLERELGRGGMATVYLARDLRHDRPVALKVLHPELAASVGTERFLREIGIAAGLAHPNILPLHDSGEAEGLLYYVMPYVAGESLRKRLTRERQLPLRDALQITREVADALDYAHAHGVVHRDIKPENILLEAGHAVLADFGVAGAIHAAADSRLTETGIVVGTPAYMSPEQGSGERQLDGRSDLYSLGCVLYEMLAGEPPFTGPSAQAVLARHRIEHPRLLRTVRPDIPPDIQELVDISLAKVPADRYSGAAEFAQALDRQSALSPRRGRERKRALRRASWAVAVALVALMVGVFVQQRSTVESQAGIRIVILPFEGGASRVETGGGQRATPQALFTNAFEWLPAVQTIDGRSLLGTAPGWRTLPLTKLLRGARGLGGQFLLVGAVLPRDEGPDSRLSVDLYLVNSAERILHGDARTHGGRFDRAIDRLTLESLDALASRGYLVLGPERALLTATTSSAALGHLLRGQEAFWQGDYDVAASQFREAVDADSGCGPGYLRLSVAEYWRYSYSEALAATQAGLRQRERLESRWRHLLEAQRHLVMGRGDSAIVGFQRVVLDDPTAIDGWLGLGEALFHFGGLTGHAPSDARPALERVVELDSTFARVYDHLFDLALYRGDSAAARRYLARLRSDDPARPAREAAIVLRFGLPAAHAEMLRRLRSQSRQVISELVTILVHGSFDLPLADSVAAVLLGPERTPDDRRRGAEYRLAALGGQGRGAEGLALWRAEAGDQRFDAWVVQAYLAGHPAGALAAPMFRWADSLLAAGRTPDFSLPLWAPPQQAFQALVHRATVEGDSSQVSNLMRRLASAAGGTDSSDPTRGALRSSLQARLALLAGDTLGAIGHLDASLSRVAEPFTVYFPLSAMAPQRLLLGELLAARNAPQQARRWLASFTHSWALADVFYNVRLRSLGAAPGAAPTAKPSPAPRR